MSHIPSGTYKARAIGYKWTKSNSGKETLAVEFELVEGGAKITWFGMFGLEPVTKDNRSQSDIAMDAMKACGWDGDLDTLPDLNGMGNSEVNLVIYEDTYNGKTRSKVRYINSVTNNRMSELPAEQVKALGMLLKNREIAKTAPIDNTQANTDEIPF